MNLLMNMTTTEITKFSLLLVENDLAKADQLIKALGNENHDIVHVIEGHVSLAQRVKQQSPDILILDIESPERDVIDSLSQCNYFRLKSIALFSMMENREIITHLVKLGLTAYISDVDNVQEVLRYLHQAILQFIDNENKLKLKVKEQELIVRATECFMRLKGISAEEALKKINKMVNNQNQNIENVSRSIIALGKMYDSPLC